MSADRLRGWRDRLPAAAETPAADRPETAIERFDRLEREARQAGRAVQQVPLMPELSPEERAVVAPVAQNAPAETPDTSKVRKLPSGRSTLRFRREKRYRWLREHAYGLRRRTLLVGFELVRRGGERGYKQALTPIGQALGLDRSDVWDEVVALEAAGFLLRRPQKHKKERFLLFRV